MIDLQRVYGSIGIASHIYRGNAFLAKKLTAATTAVSSLGGQSERPASLARRWTTRAVAGAVVAVLPITPVAVSVGPLVLMAFGLGRDPERPQSNTAVLRGVDVIRQYGLFGLPECAAAKLGSWAATHGWARLHNIALGVAIALGLVAQMVRVPVALAATSGLLADGAAQMLVGIGTALCILATQ